MLCHFLIGISGVGKSTFAQLLAQLYHCQIISTDAIRKQLYGDEIIQGNWLEIEAEVIKQIELNFRQNTAIIYDATNTQRAWRTELLQKIERNIDKIDWLAWHLNLDVEIAKKWNNQRHRQVPDNIIDRMSESLQQFPPHVAEGFIHIYEIKQLQQYNLSFIEEKLNSLQRRIINRKNRTKIENITLHPYSKLIDFDRLMHLISLLIIYPELGNLQYAYPDILEQIFGRVVIFDDAISEITGVMAKLKGNIYGDKLAIEKDLQFLINYGLVKHNVTQFNDDLNSIELTNINYNSDDIITHYASDNFTFERILNTIKTIIFSPFCQEINSIILQEINDYNEKKYYNSKPENKYIPILQGHLTNLTAQLLNQEKMSLSSLKSRKDLLRKDIEFILKPYQILPNIMRNGYFIGTGILTENELIQTFRLLQTQAKNLDDPLALDLYNKFETKMKKAHFDDNYIYPVRAIAHYSMIDTESLNKNTLSNQIPRIEKIIEEKTLVKLNKFPNRGSHEQEKKGAFYAWLLQLTFYNFAWYLAFEYHGGKEQGLLRLERLDRLYLESELTDKRTQKEQEKSLKKLTKLLSASGGIFLGNDVSKQKAFLSKNKEDKKQAEVTVELWFTEQIFNFIAEGTKRFPSQQMKMTKPPHLLSNNNSSLFSLSKSKDSEKPYRFQVTLPQWSLQDYDFLRWILGFGGQVKVYKPQSLQDRIIELSTDTLKVYKNVI